MYHLATEERVFPVSSVLDCFPFTRIRCQEKIVHDYHLPLIYIYIYSIYDCRLISCVAVRYMYLHFLCAVPRKLNTLTLEIDLLFVFACVST